MNVIDEIKQLIKHLKLGNIVAFPTDTVYALAVDSANSYAIENLYELKKRDKNKPFAVLVENIDAILKIALVSKKQKLFIQNLVPGSVTFVLEKNTSIIQDNCSNKHNTIAVRVPNHPISLQIIKNFGKPVIATSVNISGEKNINDLNEIKKMFSNVHVINAALSHKSVSEVLHSTVVSLLDDKINILRNGATDEEMLLELWEDIHCYC